MSRLCIDSTSSTVDDLFTSPLFTRCHCYPLSHHLPASVHFGIFETMPTIYPNHKTCYRLTCIPDFSKYVRMRKTFCWCHWSGGINTCVLITSSSYGNKMPLGHTFVAEAVGVTGWECIFFLCSNNFCTCGGGRNVSRTLTACYINRVGESEKLSSHHI